MLCKFIFAFLPIFIDKKGNSEIRCPVVVTFLLLPLLIPLQKITDVYCVIQVVKVRPSGRGFPFYPPVLPLAFVTAAHKGHHLGSEPTITHTA